MKKIVSVCSGLALCFSLAGCEGQKNQGGELIVFAAASMTETLGEIKPLFEKANRGVTVVYNFDSSGTLKTQIQEGADCDVFISAGQIQIDQIDIAADKSVNKNGLDCVLEGSRTNLLENKVVLCVPQGNPASIEGFNDLAAKLPAGNVLLCMGNSDVPVGQYTKRILAYYNLDEVALANAGYITYGTNVKEVTTQVVESSVDAGVVYCTDAFSAKLNILDYATAEMCGQIIYPAAVMKNSKNARLAQSYLDFLKTAEAMTIFEKVGFSRAD